jgi:hypothetical protein
MRGSRTLPLARCGGFFLAYALLFNAPVCAEKNQENVLPLVVLRVEGDGLPKVKKSIGTEEVAGANGKLFPGDHLITDGKSAVYLMLNDGTVMKLALNSELRFVRNEARASFLAWFFRLERGSLRALVEASPYPENRIHVKTPAFSVGAKGGELALSVDEVKTSSLYVLSGEASYGAQDCQKGAQSEGCAEAKAGTMISAKAGEAKLGSPKAFEARELFALPAPGEAPKAGQLTDERMTLFRDAKRVSAHYMQDTDEAALKKVLAESTEAMEDAQDRLIGRTKEERLAMQKNLRENAWRNTMAAADAYAEQMGFFSPDSNGGAEELLAQTTFSKFRLGKAVMEADQAGLFGNEKVAVSQPWEKWAKKSLVKIRKTVDYEKEDEAKATKAGLQRAFDDHKKVLEFAEALPEPRGNGAKTGHCDRQECRVRRLRHEYNAVLEGLVDAFQIRKKEESEKKDAAEPAPLQKGWIQSRWFKRAVPGNACYKELQDCKMVPCKAIAVAAKRCKKGDSVKECTKTRTLVRCRELD